MKHLVRKEGVSATEKNWNFAKGFCNGTDAVMSYF